MMRRLYVGGLSHTITQKDLRERFGKFGEVEDVELRTRRDDQGVPYKTFGYVNITITDAEFKRCTSVLNKAKWKGGTLQIEAAKESFLDRLAEERQALSEQRQQQQTEPSDPKQQVLESLKKAGVENFHMKAAVPGTEVPGHEGSWVVSKFGRVLPVVELTVRHGKRSKTVSYDPSKHSHNIKRLETADDEAPTPVSMLTWELTGGDDDISKKRRGEFPPSIPWRPKRRRTVPEDTTVGSTHSDDAALRPGAPADPRSKAPPPDLPSILPVHNGDGRAEARQAKTVSVLNNDDDDSDEEIRRLVKNHRSSQGALGQEVEDDDRLEVVGEDFLVNSGRSRQQHKGVMADKDEEDYDSADTDELLTSKRHPAPQCARGASRGKEGNTEEVQGERLKSLSQEERASGTDSPSSESEREEEEEEEDEADSSSDMEASQGENVQKSPAAADDAGGETDDDDDDEDDDDSSDDDDDSDEGDSEYEALFSNCPRLEISLADLQRLASDSQTTLPTVPCTTQTAGPPTPSASSTTQPLAANVHSRSDSESDEEEEEEEDDDDDDEDADSSSDIDASQGENVQKSPAAADDAGGETDDDDDDDDDSSDDDDDSDEGDSQTTLPTLPCTTQTASPPTPSASSTTQPLAANVHSRSTETPLPSIPCANTKPPRAPKKGTTPDEILADILENVGTSDDDEQKEVRKKKGTSLPAFQGTKKLLERIERETKEERMNEPRRTGLNSTESQNVAVTLRTETSSKLKDTQTPSEPQDTSSEADETSSETEETETSSKLPETKMSSKPQTAQTSLKLQETQILSSKPQEMESSGTQHVVTNTLSAPAGEADSNQQSVTRLNDETSSDDSSSSEEEESSIRVAEVPDEEKQRQSNLRRLAAMESRVQVVEQHKKIIQGALGNVDAPAAGSGKHTVFGSDDDDDDDVDEVKQTSVKKNLLGDSPLNDKDSGDDESIKKPSGSKLFDNSDDEDGEDEDEDSRFQIKPQFEGKAGQKLMALQSRFGTDQRFQMDSRFLESDEEEGEEGPGSQKEGEKGDLAEEKSKNLSILSSVLNINLDTHTTTHTPSKAKTFRDVLHYDPSRQEHIAFETKTEEQPKESKASRKKKREEASQLPDVSTEIYYDVSVDLKAAFGLTDHKTDEKSHDRGEGIESLGWDKVEEMEEEEEEKEEEQSGEGQRTETDVLMSTYMTSDLAAGQQDEGLGFKFSFFSDDAQPESKQETEYSVEALHGPKVSWQTDPCFQDSSSDEEEEQRDEEEEIRETTTELQTPVKKDFFFFCADDYRLTEGPRLFCRSSELGEQQEAWEEKRNSLIQDYRKKHREARKKVNFSHRS